MLGKRFMVAILVSSMILFTGCGMSGDKKTANANANSTKTENIKEGGTFVEVVASSPKALNPLYAHDRSTMTINNALFSPLYLTDKGGIKYFLAESINHSKDYLTYTLKLKKDLKWHDGKALTADDIIFTIKTILDKDQWVMSRQSYIIDNKPIECKKIDDLTVEFKLPKIDLAFENILGGLQPIPKHIFDGVKNISKSDKNNKPIGDGPYKFENFRQGEEVTLVKNDNYCLGKPHIDKIVYKVIPDTNAVKTAFLSGQINAAYAKSNNINDLKDKANFEIYDSGQCNNIVFNCKNKYLANQKVRQAIAYAINKKEAVEAANGSTKYAQLAYSVFTPNVPQFTNDVAKYDRDVNKSKELLKEAKAENITLKLGYIGSSQEEKAQVLVFQQNLKVVGIKVDLVAMAENAYYEKLTEPKYNKSFDMGLGGYSMGDEPSGYSVLFKTNGGGNYGLFSNKEIDNLWKAAAIETDTKKRNSMYVEIQQKIADEVPIYPTSYPKLIVATSKNVGGIKKDNLAPIAMFQDLSQLYFTK